MNLYCKIVEKLPLKGNLAHLMRFCSKFLCDTDSFFIRLNGVDNDGNTPESECILNRLGFPIWPLELSIVVSTSFENARFWTFSAMNSVVLESANIIFWGLFVLVVLVAAECLIPGTLFIILFIIALFFLFEFLSSGPLISLFIFCFFFC